MVPSQSYDRTSNNNSQVKGSRDWSYSTAMLGFAPNKNMSVALGQDKIFMAMGIGRCYCPIIHQLTHCYGSASIW